MSDDAPVAEMRGLLYNDEERRLRAGWRIVVTVALVTFLATLAVLVADLLGAFGADGTPVAGLPGYLGSLAVVAVPAAGLVIAAVLIDRRRVRDLGLGLGLAGGRDWWLDLLAGLALGVALPAVIFAVELGAGWLTVTGTVARGDSVLVPIPAAASLGVALAGTVAYFAVAAAFEEVLFRGYLLTNLAEGLRGVDRLGTAGAIWVATGATSLLFGVGHGWNPSATPVAIVIVALYGVLLAGGYLTTGRLALPIGFHVAWNTAIAAVFGFPVSGIAVPVTLLAVEQSGPVLLTGGSFGPEGGLVSLMGLLVGAPALAAWVRWREGELGVRAAVAVPDLRWDRDDAVPDPRRDHGDDG